MNYPALATRFAPVTPSDTAAIAGTCIGVFVGTAGDVVVVGADGVQATIKATTGSMIWGRFTLIKAATTATNIVAFFAS